MSWPLFLSTFSMIFVAELPDKTAFATLILATRGRPLPIFFGAAGAFLLQTVFAVAFGGLLGFLPARWVSGGAGVLFLAFAAHTWRYHDEEEDNAEKETPVISEKVEFLRAAWKAFVVIFIAEWGDLTQLATASLAARYRESLVCIFLASVLALWAVAAVAVLVGHRVRHVVHARALKYLGTLVYASVGVYFLVTWIRG